MILTCFEAPLRGAYEEDPSMFVVSGGIMVAERLGRAIVRISPGATFGELAMLGVSPERSRGNVVRRHLWCLFASLQRCIAPTWTERPRP